MGKYHGRFTFNCPNHFLQVMQVFFEEEHRSSSTVSEVFMSRFITVNTNVYKFLQMSIMCVSTSHTNDLSTDIHTQSS